MRIDFHGKLVDEPEIRAGFIGCGSHSFRNIYPTLQFAPINLVAVCDLSIEKAKAFAAKFGAPAAYSDYQEMIAKEELDAVFIVTGSDERGRPLYPTLTVDCLEAGCHVWIEKPPAATCAEIELMQVASKKSQKNVVVGLKKMFSQGNEKAKELMSVEDFGTPSQILIEYPDYVPTYEEFYAYMLDGKRNSVAGFLDHACHPTSIMVFLLGMPTHLYYERSKSGSGLATFRYESGAIASIAFTHGVSKNGGSYTTIGGMEHTRIISDSGKRITVENNLRVSYHRTPHSGYGNVPSFYIGSRNEVSVVWEPEFTLGQLYNKGLFLLGYYNEVNEFARSILENRSPGKGTLEHAWQVTRIFEAFAEGPQKAIPL